MWITHSKKTIWISAEYMIFLVVLRRKIISINGHIIIWIMRFLKIIGIIGIIFAIFVFICKWNKINIFLDRMLQSIYCTNKSCTVLYYNSNTAVPITTIILTSGIKLSKEVCLHDIEHEPVLLTSEEIYFYMIAQQIDQLLHMQGFSF